MERRTLLQLLGCGLASGLLPSAASAKTASGVAPASVVSTDPRSPYSEIDAESLNVGWRFHAGDIVVPPLHEQSASYMASKAGGSRGAAAPTFNDSDWGTLDLPHDWAIESPPTPTENIAQGYRKRGYAWYRRSISLDPSLAGRYLEIQFGAVATNATVWFNGSPVAHNWSGYNGFHIDVTAMATFGDKPNVLVVRVDAEAAEGWWYEGAGIYRDVWLVDRAPVSIITDGVHADPRRQADGQWTIPVEVTLYSIEKKPATVRVTAELIDLDGKVIGNAETTSAADPLWCSSLRLQIANIQPKLWSVDAPNLYQVRTRVLRGDSVLDERITPCGFRSIRFDADMGFFLNNQPLKLKGVCVHQDHAGVGVAVPPALVEWRVRQIKAMGANAIRCSHGAPDTALLDACDRLGVLVMDENRNFNVSPEYIDQLEWLVRRDRNRPCVILWSVFNEEPLQGTPNGYEMVRRAVSAVKALDDSRPVTAAMSAGMFTPVNVSQAVDVVGFNYQHASYDRFHAEHPKVPMMSSEDTSAFMTRGAWITDKAAEIESSDDTQHAGWGLSHRDAWKEIDTRPFMAGGFVWTAFDYHGEPTPFKWPANSSYFGIMDLCGFPKSAFYLRRAMWVKDRPLLDILPHWNWSGQEGKSIKVLIATNLDHVELRLNGKLVGEGVPDPYQMISFDVPYRPGTLEARGTKAGRSAAVSRVETTGAPVQLHLGADRPKLLGDGVDAQPISIEALDAKGRRVPTADLEVELQISEGRIIGVGNGNPTSAAPSKGTHVRLFNGQAQAIIQTNRGSAGKLSLIANSAGVTSGSIELDILSASIPLSLPLSFQLRVAMWRQSPVFQDRPASIPTLADNDMNSWDAVIAGESPPIAEKDGYTLLVAKASLTDAMFAKGATLRFANIVGSADVCLDGAVIGHKVDAGPGSFSTSIPAGRREVSIGVILKTVAGLTSGLPGPVVLEVNP